MLSSNHHPTLEEIGRLEAERDVITRKINQLRSTLPRETVPVVIQGKTHRVSTQKASIASLNNAPAPLDPQISDHAVIRFLERKYNFEFESLKAELLTETMKLAIRMGAASVKSNGGRFMIRGHKATTFIIDRHKK